MSLFSSVFNPSSLLSIALMPVGGPLTSMVINQLASRVLSTVMQNVMQQMDLPPFMQGALSTMVEQQFGPSLQGFSNNGDLADALTDTFGGGLLENAALRQGLDEVGDSWSNFIMEQLREREENDDSDGEGRVGGEGGWIRAMARMMGEKLDDAWHAAEDLAENIDKEDPSTSAEYQGAIQEFNFIMQAFSTAIKAAGEGATGMARKQ